MHSTLVRKRWLWLVGSVVFCCLLTQTMPVALGQDVEKFEVHEWAVWIVDPTVEQANARDRYPSAMPGVVSSIRSRQGIRDKNAVSPLSVLTFYGAAVEDLEVSLRIQSGRFVASWPKAQQKSRRLRWVDIDLTQKAAAQGRLAYVAAEHWFNQARKLKNVLAVNSGSRTEQFLTYDQELKYSIPVRIEGGPDRYQVINTSPYPVYDVLISVPTPQGRRIGWLETVAASAQALKKKAATPRNKEGKLPVAALKPNAGVGGTVAQVELSAPLKADSAAFKSQAPQALKKRLLDTGLTQSEVDLILTIYTPAIFESSEMVVLFRLPRSVVDELIPLDFFPEPQKTLRTTLALVRNIDPGLKREVDSLVGQLGDADYAKREASEKRLRELGSIAIPALRKALKHQDLEIVFRAERLLLSGGQSIDDK